MSLGSFGVLVTQMIGYFQEDDHLASLAPGESRAQNVGVEFEMMKDRVMIRAFLKRAIEQERAIHFHMHTGHTYTGFPAVINEHYVIIYTNHGRTLLDLDRVVGLEPLTNGELREFLVDVDLTGLDEDRQAVHQPILTKIEKRAADMSTSEMSEHEMTRGNVSS